MTQRIAELSPLRKLVFAALVAIVCAQAVAMTMLARSQVEKAEVREAAETSNCGAVVQRADSGRQRSPLPITVGHTGSR